MPHPAFAWSLVLSAGVVFASLIPLGAARSQADFVPADLAAPRAMFERLPAWGKRPTGPTRTVLRPLACTLPPACWP